MAGFLEDLRAGRAAPEDVEALLRELLSDPTLELRFFLPESQLYVDAQGMPVADAPRRPAECVPIERGGQPLGQVLHSMTSQEHARCSGSSSRPAGWQSRSPGCASSCAVSLAEVQASRTRIVAAANEERRRIERDLHDGAQQRFVSIGLALRHAQHALGASAPEVSQALEGAVAEITLAIDELRELARGLRAGAARRRPRVRAAGSREQGTAPGRGADVRPTGHSRHRDGRLLHRLRRPDQRGEARARHQGRAERRTTQRRACCVCRR